MATEAKWADGQSVLPQARTVQTIEWLWANGSSGDIAADEYVAAGTIPPAGSLVASGAVPIQGFGLVVPTTIYPG